MAEITNKDQSRRSTKIGQVVSTKMAKTIVVETVMKKSHPLYRRVIAKSISSTRMMRTTQREWAITWRLKRPAPCQN
jgi:ribosomal protein S17